MSQPDPALAALKQLLGPKGFSTDAEELAPHLKEWRGLYQGRTALMLKPASTEEVAAAVAICHKAGLPLVPQGGNTGLVGGGLPDESGSEILISLSRLNKIRAKDALNYTLTVEAGCILGAIQNAASEMDRLFPLSLAAEGSCEIGGNISTNAGGIAVLRYGSMRDLVLGLEVVLPDGRIWHGLKHLRKDNTGYDLKQLFIGAEGTLGIITAATLKLFPKPKDRATAIVALPNPAAAIELLSLAREHSGDSVSAFELIPRLGLDFVLRHIPGTREPLEKTYPWYALIELTSASEMAGLQSRLERILSDGMTQGLVIDGAIAATLTQTASFWHLREDMSESQRHEGGSIKHDISVPVSKVADFIQEASAAAVKALPGIRPVAFGHVGDGNVHFNLSQPVGADTGAFLARRPEMNRIVHDIVAGMGGSISAEHGIGRLKVDELAHYKDPLELLMMQQVKKAFDPENLMNPGRILRKT
jgi:FAD/FMN-containing dehydrogenase